MYFQEIQYDTRQHEKYNKQQTKNLTDKLNMFLRLWWEILSKAHFDSDNALCVSHLRTEYIICSASAIYHFSDVRHNIFYVRIHQKSTRKILSHECNIVASKIEQSKVILEYIECKIE